MSSFIIDDLKNAFRRKDNGVIQIIVTNVIVFLIINIVSAFIQFSNIPQDVMYIRMYKFLSWFSLPAAPYNIITRFWTIITYMFSHEGFFHILFNMLWFYWFGKILTGYLGNKRMISTYILGGICGGLFFIVIYNLMNFFNPGIYQFQTTFMLGNEDASTILLGASASVMAIVFAVATLLPDNSIRLLFIGNIKFKYLALGALVLTTILDFSDNTGGKIAHLGGAFYGWLYIKQYRKGRDFSKGFNRFMDSLFSFFMPAKKIRVEYKSRQKHSRPVSDKEYNAQKAREQAEIDNILDKIAKSGYDSLTKEEKDRLFRMSNR